jgi:hypothetical protein
VDEIDSVLETWRAQAEHGDAWRIADLMKRYLGKWRQAVVSGHYDERERRGEAGALFRVMCDSGDLLERPLGRSIMELANRYVRNER